ncbi:LysR substrate-binding domain-containing protein [Cupriavidus sp. AU9028]|uniref:LysR substrate-binding domain-containing protein n=1 Tax=Cupriavidus sp. AU9028 TaxID=2871157 RepID=UPI001C98298E|nr:LysR substrate-binding domain-containing protein [Cupriavidus sp. AU9028]MBY4895721.1 LysR family transcriptional regulator [Cupriavidus sp. AU9028]
MHGRDHLDTYLLRVLHTLLTEQSVTRTAVRLGQSQPAISNTLKRLREITGDAILVRGKNGMVPTERGRELLALAEQGLAAMERIARPPQQFEPGTTTRTFHIGAPDYLDAFFLPNVVERVRRLAPQARLSVHPMTMGSDFVEGLEQGRLDIVIGNWLSPPEHLHISPLFEDEVVCMLGEQHPLARKGLSLKHYLDMPHLAPAPYASSQRSMIDQALAELGHKRRIQVTLPYFGLVPYVLMKTDMVFTTGRQFAAHYAQYLPVRMVAAPVKFPPMRFYQLWHQRSHAAPDVQWLRRMVAEAAAELPALPRLEIAGE